MTALLEQAITLCEKVLQLWSFEKINEQCRRFTITAHYQLTIQSALS